MSSLISFSLKTILRTNKPKASGECPIRIRITVARKTTEISIGRYVLPSKWDVLDERVKGSNEGARTINHHIQTTRNGLFQAHTELTQEHDSVTAKSIRDRYKGSDRHTIGLLNVFKFHIRRLKELADIGQGNTASLVKWNTINGHLTAFLQEKERVDISISNIDTVVISDFDHYLRVKKGIGNNTAVKYMWGLKSVLMDSLEKYGIVSHPFRGYKGKLEKVNKEFLSITEINTLCQRTFDNPRLQKVLDCFLFSCFTGLRYSDVRELHPHHVVRHINGKRYIGKEMKKTGTNCFVPLIKPALKLLNKYKNDQFCLTHNVLFPIPTNQKTNEYLKEIAAICRIDKTLTFHTARHTFSAMLKESGVQIETTSKLLGHTNIRMTDHYGGISDEKIFRDVGHLNKMIQTAI